MLEPSSCVRGADTGPSACLLTRTGCEPGAALQGLRLATLTLINPDTSLREFRAIGEELIKLCPLVTVFGDRKDIALIGASMVLGLHSAWVSALLRSPKSPGQATSR